MNNQEIISQIKVVDNFFPLLLQKQIIRDYLQSDDVKWSYRSNISYSSDNIESMINFKNWSSHGKVEDTDGFSYQIEESNPKNSYVFTNIKSSAKKHFGIEIKQFLRVMLVFCPPNPLYDPNHHLPPHIDRPTPYNNILYYLVDNDADTLFFNQMYEPKKQEDFAKQEIIHRIKPKQGRATLFNGWIYHAGNVSKIKKRLTLNINFI